MQKADRPGHRIELVTRETLSDVGEVQRRLFEDGGNLFGEFTDDFRRCLPGLTIGLAADIVRYLGGVGVGVGNTFKTLLGNSLGDRRIDAYLGGGRHDAMRCRRETGVQGFAAGVADDHDVAVALDPGRDRPFDFDRIENVDVVIDNDDVFYVHDRQSGQKRVLSVAGLLLDRDDRVPEGYAAHRHIDVLDDNARGAQRLPDRGIAG